MNNKKRQPGDDLERLFTFLRIQKTLDCDCQDMIDLMNERGLDWCRENKPFIVDRIRENAKKTNYPFNAIAVMWLVRIALA